MSYAGSCHILTTASKPLTLEVVYPQMQNYLSTNNLNATMQSAYRQNHSCETALLRVCNDLLLTLDNGHEAVLLLLDYSAAFDTISHEILLQRLQHRFGFRETALNWLQSYITNRSQSVAIGDYVSSSLPLKQGVPQGSVMGPIVFTMYSSPLDDIIKSHGFGHAIYADDTQVYTILHKDDYLTVIPRLESCLNEIQMWSSANALKINVGNTELLHLSSRFRNKTVLPPIMFNKVNLKPAQCARNLGVVLDNHLTMTHHINNICRASSNGLYKIGKIRQFLNQNITERLIHAFVMSRLDNCNGLLYGLPDSLLVKLQRIQNSAARLITRTCSHEPISPVLYNLHWLPVKQRIIFKLLVTTFKCKHGLAPQYLQELIQNYCPARNLRSGSRNLLTPFPATTKAYGKRAFQVASPELWNSLPNNIKESPSLEEFKSILKTYLFVK